MTDYGVGVVRAVVSLLIGFVLSGACQAPFAWLFRGSPAGNRGNRSDPTRGNGVDAPRAFPLGNGFPGRPRLAPGGRIPALRASGILPALSGVTLSVQPLVDGFDYPFLLYESEELRCVLEPLEESLVRDGFEIGVEGAQKGLNRAVFRGLEGVPVQVPDTGSREFGQGGDRARVLAFFPQNLPQPIFRLEGPRQNGEILGGQGLEESAFRVQGKNGFEGLPQLFAVRLPLRELKGVLEGKNKRQLPEEFGSPLQTLFPGYLPLFSPFFELVEETLQRGVRRLVLGDPAKGSPSSGRLGVRPDHGEERLCREGIMQVFHSLPSSRTLDPMHPHASDTFIMKYGKPFVNDICDYYYI